MSELGKHLQFPIRTFHKPNYLKEFTARLGLYACKEQKGKAVMVCVHAPQDLLDAYRQANPPTGAWLQHGWLGAVYDAMDAGLPPQDDPAESAVPMITATPTEEPVPHLQPGSTIDPGPQPGPSTSQHPGQQSEQLLGLEAAQTAPLHGSVAVDGMPAIPAPPPPVTAHSLAAAQLQDVPGVVCVDKAAAANREQLEAARRSRAEAEMEGMQPWIGDQSKIAWDRIRRMLEQLDDAGFVFKSALRRFLKVSACCRHCPYICTFLPVLSLHFSNLVAPAHDGPAYAYFPPPPSPAVRLGCYRIATCTKACGRRTSDQEHA